MSRGSGGRLWYRAWVRLVLLRCCGLGQHVHVAITSRSRMLAGVHTCLQGIRLRVYLPETCVSPIPVFAGWVCTLSRRWWLVWHAFWCIPVHSGAYHSMQVGVCATKAARLPAIVCRDPFRIRLAADCGEASWLFQTQTSGLYNPGYVRHALGVTGLIVTRVVTALCWR